MDTPQSRRAVVEPLEGCPPEIGASLWTLQETRRRTLAYVQGMSQDALDWEPSGKRHNVGTLLYHIAAIEVDWLYIDILGRKYDEERGIPECPPELADRLPYPVLLDDGAYTPVGGEPLTVHEERLSVIRKAFVDTLTGMSLEDFRSLRPSGNDEVTPEWVIEHLAQHEAEHRGQIWEVREEAETALGASSDED